MIVTLCSGCTTRKATFYHSNQCSKKSASSSIFSKTSEQTCFLANYWTSLRFFGATSAHTFFMLKFVSPHLCPYSSSPLSFWCLNNDLFSQESSPFPHFHQVSSLLDGQVIHLLPHPLFLLETFVPFKHMSS